MPAIDWRPMRKSIRITLLVLTSIGAVSLQTAALSTWPPRPKVANSEIIRRVMSRPSIAIVLTLIGLSAQGRSTAQPAVSNDTTARAAAAAKAFLATLDAAGRAKAALALNEKTRAVWSNLPTGITLQMGATERNGLKLGEMTPAQQKAALNLLSATLSRDGFEKVMNIVMADEALETRTAPTRPAGNRIKFGRAEYYLAVLGTPSTSAPWILQFGGHHLGINVTLAGRENVLTPSHTGTQPASYSLESRTIRPLGDENDKAFSLMNALSPEQQKQAILGYEVRNIVAGPGEDGKVIVPEGVAVSTFNGQQRTILLDLVREWVGILGADAAAAKMAEIEANLGATRFAWSGPTSNGSPAYFRIQGPTVLIEYAPQGQGGASTDHIHTIYRDPTNEYGAKATR
jgi:hypothetical protein